MQSRVVDVLHYGPAARYLSLMSMGCVSEPLGGLGGLLEGQQRDIDSACTLAELLYAKVHAAEKILGRVLSNPCLQNVVDSAAGAEVELLGTRHLHAGRSRVSQSNRRGAAHSQVPPVLLDPDALPFETVDEADMRGSTSVAQAPSDGAYGAWASRIKMGTALQLALPSTTEPVPQSTKRMLVPRGDAPRYELGRPFAAQQREQSARTSRRSASPTEVSDVRKPSAPSPEAPTVTPQLSGIGVEVSATFMPSPPDDVLVATAVTLPSGKQLCANHLGAAGPARAGIWADEIDFSCTSSPSPQDKLTRLDDATDAEDEANEHEAIATDVVDHARAVVMLDSQRELFREDVRDLLMIAVAEREQIVTEYTAWVTSVHAYQKRFAEDSESVARAFVLADEEDDRRIREELCMEERHMLLCSAFQHVEVCEKVIADDATDEVLDEEKRVCGHEGHAANPSPQQDDTPPAKCSAPGVLIPTVVSASAETARSESPVVPSPHASVGGCTEPAPETLAPSLQHEETVDAAGGDAEAREAVARFVCCDTPLNPEVLAYAALHDGTWKKKLDKTRDPPRPFFINKRTKQSVWNLCKHMVATTQGQYRQDVDAEHLPSAHCKRCKAYFKGIPRMWRCTGCQACLLPAKTSKADATVPCAACQVEEARDGMRCQVCGGWCCKVCTKRLPLPSLGFPEPDTFTVCSRCTAPGPPAPPPAMDAEWT